MQVESARSIRSLIGEIAASCPHKSIVKQFAALDQCMSEFLREPCERQTNRQTFNILLQQIMIQNSIIQFGAEQFLSHVVDAKYEGQVRRLNELVLALQGYCQELEFTNIQLQSAYNQKLYFRHCKPSEGVSDEDHTVTTDMLKQQLCQYSQNQGEFTKDLQKAAQGAMSAFEEMTLQVTKAHEETESSNPMRELGNVIEGITQQCREHTTSAHNLLEQEGQILSSLVRLQQQPVGASPPNVGELTKVEDIRGILSRIEQQLAELQV